ncbi:MAG: hypothetical protein ACYTHM_13515 [Planctomycetota bacterium]
MVDSRQSTSRTTGRTFRRFGWHVVLPVVAGGCIYVLWRSTDLFVFDWIRFLGLEGTVLALRDGARSFGSVLPAWFLFSLPDGLWAYAVTACMILIWRGEKGKGAVGWICVGPFLAVGSEIGQMVSVVPGAFSFLDVAFYTAGSIAAVCLVAFRKGGGHVEETRDLHSGSRSPRLPRLRKREE